VIHAGWEIIIVQSHALLPRGEDGGIVGAPQPLERTHGVDPAQLGLRDRAHGVGQRVQRRDRVGVRGRNVRVAVPVDHEERDLGHVDHVEAARLRGVQRGERLLDVVLDVVARHG
jgi:hypothetical protein